MTIPEAIRTLLDNREIDEELFRHVAAIATRMLSGAQVPDTVADSPESMAADFLLALADKKISGEIASGADLGREFRRWLTRRNNPQGAELWRVVSKALHTLEEAGRIQRPPEKRDYYNHNNTAWYLPEYAGRKPDWEQEPRIAAAMPFLQGKGAGDRVLKPQEAQAAILAVLRTLAGEVPMKRIVSCIGTCVPMFLISRSLNEPASDDGDTAEDENVEAQEVAADYEHVFAEEAECAAAGIWRAAGEIRRGTDPVIEGRHILCCHWIPKEVAGAKSKLEDFGPSSTVHDIVVDLKRVLAEWLPSTGIANSRSSWDDWFPLEVSRRVVIRLAGLCSENGLCRPFYEKWIPEAL